MQEIFTVRAEALRMRVILGIMSYERDTPQGVSVDLEADYVRDGAYLDYRDLIRIAKETLEQGRYELIEEALPAIREHILAKYPAIIRLRIKITKPEAVTEALVSVQAEWKQKGG
jgi:7,8-dihydroneopterin aldolase/epimerase/oxygenase